MKTSLLLRWVLFLMLLVATSEPVSAQCAMCRQAASSNIEGGDKKGRGLNSGILYLMAIPYAMGGVAGLIWWKYRKSTQPAN